MNAEPVALCEEHVRRGFIRKVYGILFVQLAVTTVIAGAVMVFADTIRESNPGMLSAIFYASLALTLGLSCAIGCCSTTMRTFPWNYIMLFAFTAAEAVLVGIISAQYTIGSVLVALGMTAFIVIALTAFACQTKYDFTGFGPYLYCALMVLLAFGFVVVLIAWFGGGGSGAFTILNTVYAAGGALLFSAFIVYDTQLIVGGKHRRYQFSIDDYAFAALNLYVDIVQLFLFLLSLFGDRK